MNQTFSAPDLGKNNHLQKEIENKINDLKSAAQGDDISQINKSSEVVQQTFHALSQQIYAQGQPQAEAAGGPSTPPMGDDDVIEGEVKE